jgi:hypothetical protein
MANCLCGVMPTFGQPGCYQTMGYPVKIGFQDVKDSTGASNGILPTDTLNHSFISGLINNADTSKRLMLTPSVVITTTGFVSKIDTIYGAKYDSTVFAGGVLADFTLYNETTASSVTITSVTEAPDGTYTFVIPAQSSADVLTLTFSKLGFYASSTLSITIP